ncbi:MAG TPA: hypothetical protein VGC21_20210 [Telluria sp.]|jgi:uncharacterized membrane protein
MRFPYISLGFFLLTLAATGLSAYLSSTSCAFGFGGFQCNGWVGQISGLLFGWSMLAVVVIPLSFIVALWRLIRWQRRRRAPQS